MSAILQVISSPQGGGAELLTRELHKIYKARKLNSHVVYLSGGDDGLMNNELVLSVNPRSPFNVFRIRRVIKSFLENNGGDELIVHSHLTWPFLYVALASFRLSGVDLIYTEHSTTNKRRKLPLLWLFERILYSRYSRIICISQGVYDALAKWVGPKVAKNMVTIPNGSRIYTLAKRTTLEGRLPRLVSIGSLTSRKNFSTAIHAIEQLRDEIESYTIVGEGPERNQLEKLIKSEKLESKVSLVGWSDEIEQHLHSADIQVIPSLWEGFGLVAVEGMSTGLPVVASNVDGLREVLDECNPSVTLIDQVESVDDWVIGIRRAIADLHAKSASYLAKLSRQQAEKYTLDEMADRYLNTYGKK